MRNQEWDSSFAQLNPLDFAQFVFRLFGRDAVNSEATLGIINESEGFSSLLDRNDVHEASRECCVCSNFSIYLDEALHDDSLCLARIEGILQSIFSPSVLASSKARQAQGYDLPVSNEDDKWHAITELVWTWGWTGCVCS